MRNQDAAGREPMFVSHHWRRLRAVPRLGFAVCVLAGTLLTTAVASPAQASSVAQSATGTWGTAQEVPGTAALNTGGNAVINSVSCAPAGNCSAGGTYAGSGGYQAFVVDEIGGVWGTAQEVPGTAALNTGGNAVINSVSCASAGNCSAGGTYVGPYIGESSSDNRVWQQAFVVDETGGIWGTAQQVPGIPMITTGVPSPDWVTSVSCASAGNCAAVGQFEDYTNVRHVFVFDETGGIWGTAQEIAPNVGPSLSVSSVSCASAGNCSTGGQNAGDISHYAQAFVADETGGIWGTAQAVPGIAALDSDGQGSLPFSGESGINSVSCASAGYCSAVGQYRDSQDMGWRYHVFVVDETGGVWGNAQEVPGSAALNAGANTDSSSVNISSVSCASAGNCSAGGTYTDASGTQQAFVVDETGGVWGNAQEVPGTAALNTGGKVIISSVSCASAGNCSGGGTYTDGSGDLQTFVVDETDGVWGTAQEVPGTAALNTGGTARIFSVSCGSAGNCSAGGSYIDGSGNQQALVVSEPTGTAPAITSAASASAGMRSPFSFTATTTGDPTAALTESGALPAGVTFTDNGDGTATLAGTPAAGTAGSYPITITASNGVGGPATQAFMLTVTTAASAPVITSPAANTETFGVPFSITVTTNGYPAPKITKTGALPAGVQVADNGDGTATISGVPSRSAVGVYPLTLTAKNSAGTATQAFILTVTKAPVIKNIPATTAHVGAALNLTITATGYTTPALTESGTLPAGLSFTDNGNGTATITGTPAPSSGGSYQITITATNQLGTTSQAFTLRVDQPPSITSLDTAAAVTGTGLSFQVIATGFPTPKITENGTLPKGLTFNKGTATLSGTPKAGTSGTYPVTFTATNNTGTTTQTFTLTVTS